MPDNVGPDEEAVTTAVERYLRRCRWRVLAVHRPGGQGGVYFHRATRRARGAAGAVLIDIVARLGRWLLLVESKARFSSADVRKLETVMSDPAYSQALRDVSGFRGDFRLVGGIAVGRRPRLAQRIPAEFAVFIASTPIEVWAPAELLSVLPKSTARPD